MTKNNWSMNDWADYWRSVGFNPLPSNGKIPIVEYKQFFDKPIPIELHNYWKKMGYFNNGISVINGRLWNHEYRKNIFGHVVDTDSEAGSKLIMNVNGVQLTPEDMIKKGIAVESTPRGFHFFIFSDKELPHLASNKSGIEVKGSNKLTTVTPTMTEDFRRELIGDSLKALENCVLHSEFMYHVNDKVKTLGIDYLNGKGDKNTKRVPIYKDDDDDTKKWYKGERNNKLHSWTCSRFRKFRNVLSTDDIKALVYAKDLRKCEPPLQYERDPPNQVENLCKSAKEFIDEEMEKKVQQEEEELILDQKISKQDINFVMETMTKEAEHDQISIKQLFYGMASGFTKTVIHHILNSKSAGSGKSYLLILVSDFFPKKYVLVLIGASDKALQHKEGIMVLEDIDTGELTEVEPIINKLGNEILHFKEQIESEKSNEKDKKKDLIKNLQKQILEKEEQIKSILDRQQKLIILNDTIMLLLDTPQDGFYDGLMSLLSNDTNRDQKYLFTDKSTSGKLGSRTNILRGTPVMFTTRVIDDTRNQRFEERNRRFINVTPNVSSKKIEDANILILKGAGLSPEEYDQSVVSRQDKDKARKIISVLVEKLINHSKFLEPKQYGIKIPFIHAIKIPNNAEWSMTVMRRLVGYLSIITKVNMDMRPRLVRKDNPNIFLPIATFEDFKQALELMERGATNIRTYIADWYNDVFLPVFKAEDGKIRQVTKNIGERDEKTLKENYVAVTSTQLKDKTLEIKHLSIGNEDLRHKFIDPLINQGVIDKARSEIRGTENIYFPVDERGENIFSLFSSDLKLTVKDPSLYPIKDVIVSAFSPIDGNQARNRNGDNDSGILEKKSLLDTYRLVDHDGKEITPEQLADRYFSDPDTCFIKDFKEKEGLED